MNQINVTIPATTANLGPGFDCLGLALGLYNTVTFTAVATPSLTITVTGEGADSIPKDETNLVYQAAEFAFEHFGKRPLGLRIHQHNNIPVSSGMGSSAAAVLGGVVAASGIVHSGCAPADLLQLAHKLEGHPDNVTPAFYGGLTLITENEFGFHVEQITIPTQKVVIVLPDFDFPTVEARAVLPQQVTRQDAIFNASHLALLVRALEAGDYNKLAYAMQDRMHQARRAALVPGMDQAWGAARAAGAVAVALSGAGPSIIAFAPQHHETIAAAAMAAFAKCGLASRYWILPIDCKGCCW